MSKGRFSKKAKRHAAESRARTRRMLKEAPGRSGPVVVSYLPGFEPPKPKPPRRLVRRTQFPFWATINGRDVLVSKVGGEISVEYDEPDDWEESDEEWEEMQASLLRWK